MFKGSQLGNGFCEIESTCSTRKADWPTPVLFPDVNVVYGPKVSSSARRSVSWGWSQRVENNSLNN